MTLPSADELLTGVSKHAHGSVDGLEDPERKVDWRAVGAGLRHYLPVVSALALAVALVGAGLMSDGCVEIVNVLHRHDITVSYLFRYRRSHGRSTRPRTRHVAASDSYLRRGLVTTIRVDALNKMRNKTN